MVIGIGKSSLLPVQDGTKTVITADMLPQWKRVRIKPDLVFQFGFIPTGHCGADDAILLTGVAEKLHSDQSKKKEKQGRFLVLYIFD